LQLFSFLVQSLELALLLDVGVAVFFLAGHVLGLQLLFQTLDLLFQDLVLALYRSEGVPGLLFRERGIPEALFGFRDLVLEVVEFFLEGSNALVPGLERLSLLDQSLLAGAEVGL